MPTLKEINELIHCQMIVGTSGEKLRCNPDFSNVRPVFVDEETLEVYDENEQYIGKATRRPGSNIFEVKLKAEAEKLIE